MNKINQFPKNNVVDEWLGVYRAQKYGNKSLIACAILVALFFSLCSCSSRKVDKSKTETTESQTSTKSVIDSSKTITFWDSNHKILHNSTSDEITFEPVDNTKPIVINGKSYLNVKLSTKKVKSSKVTEKDLKSVKSTQNSVKEVNNQQSNKTVKAEVKKVEKTASYWWLFWTILIFLIIALLLVVYYYWNRYKKSRFI
jgi:ATP-dependent Zn protease